MKTVRVHEYGGPEVLRLEDLPDPAPGPGEVRVRAEAIGVGVPDMLMRSGNYNWIPPFPFAPGNELAGTVDAVGAGVTRFKAGDRVFVSARELPQRGGGYSEAVVVPAEAPFAMPAGVSPEQAVTLGNYQLGWLLLNYAAKPQAGQTVLVHAAAGGAGSAVVQLAKRQGLTVFGIAGGADKVRYVGELGADAVIDRTRDDIGARIAELTGGTGVEFIYDSVGGPNFNKDFGMLAAMGMVVQFGYIGGPPEGDVYKAMRAVFGNSVALRLFSIHVLDDRPDIRRHAMEQAMAALAAGEIAPRIHASLKLADAAEAHRLLETGGVTGKVVLVP
jgi:NADPH2:quinone reductase